MKRNNSQTERNKGNINKMNNIKKINNVELKAKPIILTQNLLNIHTQTSNSLKSKSIVTKQNPLKTETFANRLEYNDNLGAHVRPKIYEAKSQKVNIKNSPVKKQNVPTIKKPFKPSDKYTKIVSADPFATGKKHKTNFGYVYSAGGIPCRIEHGSVYLRLKWDIEPESN
jgi:hypothetical protein